MIKAILFIGIIIIFVTDKHKTKIVKRLLTIITI